MSCRRVEFPGKGYEFLDMDEYKRVSRWTYDSGECSEDVEVRFKAPVHCVLLRESDERLRGFYLTPEELIDAVAKRKASRSIKEIEDIAAHQSKQKTAPLPPEISYRTELLIEHLTDCMAVLHEPFRGDRLEAQVFKDPQVLFQSSWQWSLSHLLYLARRLKSGYRAYSDSLLSARSHIENDLEATQASFRLLLEPDDEPRRDLEPIDTVKVLADRVKETIDFLMQVKAYVDQQTVPQSTDDGPPKHSNQEKFIIVLCVHHKLNGQFAEYTTPIALRDLATQAAISVGSASHYFKTLFGGHDAYAGLCSNGSIGRRLDTLAGNMRLSGVLQLAGASDIQNSSSRDSHRKKSGRKSSQIVRHF